MFDIGTIQSLKKIVVDMGFDNVCEHPSAFAGAILDMCNANEVKLLTNVLRSHYSVQLMGFFRNGDSNAATWAQQKAFLIDESGMSVDNAESVLDVLWKAMGWQRPQPTQPNKTESKPAGELPPKVDPKYRKEYVDTRRLDPSPEYKPYANGQATSDRGHGSVQDRHNADQQASDPAKPNIDRGVETQPKPQVKTPTSKWVPVLISVVWILLAFQTNRDMGTNDLMTRIQNADYTLILFLAAPIIATLFVCIKGIPGFLRGLAAFVLGVVSGYNMFMSVYWLDKYVFKFGLLLAESGFGIFLTIVLAFISLSVGLVGGAACASVQE